MVITVALLTQQRGTVPLGPISQVLTSPGFVIYTLRTLLAKLEHTLAQSSYLLLPTSVYTSHQNLKKTVGSSRENVQWEVTVFRRKIQE